MPEQQLQERDRAIIAAALRLRALIDADRMFIGSSYNEAMIGKPCRDAFMRATDPPRSEHGLGEHVSAVRRGDAGVGAYDLATDDAMTQSLCPGCGAKRTPGEVTVHNRWDCPAVAAGEEAHDPARRRGHQTKPSHCGDCGGCVCDGCSSKPWAHACGPCVCARVAERQERLPSCEWCGSQTGVHAPSCRTILPLCGVCGRRRSDHLPGTLWCFAGANTTYEPHPVSEGRFVTSAGDMRDLMSREGREQLWKSYGPDGPPDGHVIRRLLLTLDQKDGEIELLDLERQELVEIIARDRQDGVEA